MLNTYGPQPVMSNCDMYHDARAPVCIYIMYMYTHIVSYAYNTYIPLCTYIYIYIYIMLMYDMHKHTRTRTLHGVRSAINFHRRMPPVNQVCSVEFIIGYTIT